MSKIKFILSIIAVALIILLAAGCSDDKTTTTTATPGESNPIELVDIGAIIESVAPPEYVAPTAAPSELDSVWQYGQSPLLEKVFGASEPQALYANIDEFKLNLAIISGTMRVDENGDVILGTYVDSHTVDMGDGEMTMHFTAVASALDGPTTVPTMAQEVIGTEVDLDYLINVSVDEMPGGEVKIGIKLNDTIQTIFQWDDGTSEGDEQTRMIYASLDPSDSSFVFKGLGYCQHPVSDEWPNGDRYCWAYNISADADGEFAYRMSYFSNGTPGMTFLHCFLGGGNRENEFAIKYRMFSPADTTVCDSLWMKDQVFGPNYSEGTGLITDYSSYLNEEYFITNDNVPATMIPDPWIE